MTAPVITIDGPGGSGKGTIAALLAKHLGWHLLDSGALYRALACAAQNHGISLLDESRLVALASSLEVRFVTHEQQSCIFLEGREVGGLLRTEQMGSAASTVAALAGVRAALLGRQRAFLQLPGLVADGRDMGTVVFPSAVLKIFLTASVEERARRRFVQLKAKSEAVSLATLIEEIAARDQRDTVRTVSPLVPAESALLLDSTKLSIDQVLERILREISQQNLFV